ncbi:hypothetical protein MKP08_05685 [Erythrobacter sp. LQ02-29]|uniref:tetratricopeptide repeat protein n=1 Tax=Erythrobacter sp. LQ02-29 TaxID=2920384 RepID=UPI001F4E5501|nr:hypothetical protein [Erythrobacter sp. LQ02-29]MCP9222236.1 hypothetical protein [Erythrobacter sp. LQ02-29]
MIRRHRNILWGAALAALTLQAVPAAAQDADAEVRLRKLEAEVRALQRTVFPGGDSRYFEPEITGAPRTGAQPSTTSTTAVTDVLARLDAMESSLQRLTAQVEQNANSLSELDTRLSALETTGTAAAAAAQGNSTPATTVSTPANRPPTTAATTSSPPASSTPAPTPSGPTAQRLAAVQQIMKPQTDDAGDDEYSYGFRLWDAGFFPEAEQQLTLFVDKYPSHWRTTYGRNLLGRAYLDDGKPREAAAWFIKNYQADRAAARAPDSLLYLAVSMIALDDTNRACIALSEFSETYPSIAAGRLQSEYEANRKKVTCKN